MKTFKNIIDDLQDFATNHNQLNSFGWGNTSEITTKDSVYPQMFVQPINSTIANSQLDLTMEIYVMDLLKHNRDNLIDVMDSTLLIGRDIIAQYFEDNDGYEFELQNDNINIVPFEGKFDDVLGGWIFKVSLITRLNLKPCISPIDNLKLEAVYSVDERIIEPYLTTVTLTASGGTGDYTYYKFDGSDWVETIAVNEQGFNTTQYKVIDTGGVEETLDITLAIPTPDDSMKWWIDLYQVSGNATLRFSVPTVEPVYVNWGDGTPIQKLDYNGTSAYWVYHTYTETGRWYNIDVYGGIFKLEALYSYVTNPIIKASWFTKFGPDKVFDKITTERTLTLDFTLDELQNINSKELFYKFRYSMPAGDVRFIRHFDKVYLNSISSGLDRNIRPFYAPMMYGEIGDFIRYYEKDGMPFIGDLQLAACGYFTYTNRLTAPITIETRLLIRGHSDYLIRHSIGTPNEVAMLLIDLDTYVVRTGTPGIIDLRYNQHPIDADEPYRTNFLAAVANLVADGWIVYYES